MARKIRIEYAGAAYHVMACGNQGRDIYVGGTEFKERMLALVEQPLRQGRSSSYSGEARRAHGEAEGQLA
jgi:hypothetical protein